MTSEIRLRQMRSREEHMDRALPFTFIHYI